MGQTHVLHTKNVGAQYCNRIPLPLFFSQSLYLEVPSYSSGASATACGVSAFNEL